VGGSGPGGHKFENPLSDFTNSTMFIPNLIEIYHDHSSGRSYKKNNIRKKHIKIVKNGLFSIFFKKNQKIQSMEIKTKLHIYMRDILYKVFVQFLTHQNISCPLILEKK
jgi:hypothetical protein